jgi:hypothetical protein
LGRTWGACLARSHDAPRTLHHAATVHPCGLPPGRKACSRPTRLAGPASSFGYKPLALALRAEQRCALRRTAWSPGHASPGFTGVHGGSRADGGADGAEGLQHTCSQADTGISRQAHAGRRMRVNPVVPLPRATQPRGRRGESEKRARRHGLLPLPPLLGFDEICLDQASARPPPLPNTPGQQGWRYCSLRLRPDLGALPTCRCLAIRISSLSAIKSFFGIQFESDRAKSCSGSPGPHCQITSEFSKEREQEYSEYRARR